MCRGPAILAVGLALLTLQACGDQGRQGIFLPLAARLVPAVGDLAGVEDPAAGAIARPGFTPAEIAANLTGFQYVGVPTMGPPVPARLVQNNGARQTWDVQVGFTVAFDDGMLVATRGLGGDLMGANTTEVRAALNAGGGQATRLHDYLDGMDQVVTESFACEIVAQGTEEIDLGLRRATLAKFSETCRNARVEFENLYWLDDRGQVLSSRQYVSRTVAYLRNNRL
jgi:hypothetical protein